MDQQRHIGTEEVRSGVTHQNVRYILAISLALVLIAFAAIYFWGGGSTGEESQNISTVTPSQQAQP